MIKSRIFSIKNGFKSATNFQQKNLWLIFQYSVLILPLFPALGELGLLIVLIGVWRFNFSQIVRDVLNWGWLALAVWLVINSSFAYHSQDAWLGLANFLPFFALFIAVSRLINSFEKLFKLAWLLIIPSVPIVFFGLVQLYLKVGTPQLLATILGWQLIPLGVPEGRMSSVFIYANFLAVYLSFTFILSLGLWLYNWYQYKATKVNFLLLSFILIINSIGLVLANSRNSWLIVFIACLAFAIYLGWYWIVFAISAAVAVIFGASFGDFSGQIWLRKIVPQFIWSRLSDRMYPDRPIETLRITKWQFSLLKIQERPLMGWGLRNFTPLYLEQSNFWFGHPHNLFIMLTLETGIVGTTFFCFLVGYILFKAILILKSMHLKKEEKLILFTYLLTSISCILFNIFDVTIFDLRVNTISWIILGAVASVNNFKNSSAINVKC